VADSPSPSWICGTAGRAPVLGRAPSPVPAGPPIAHLGGAGPPGRRSGRCADPGSDAWENGDRSRVRPGGGRV